jgi:hypothetical protein
VFCATCGFVLSAAYDSCIVMWVKVSGEVCPGEMSALSLRCDAEPVLASPEVVFCAE